MCRCTIWSATPVSDRRSSSHRRSRPTANCRSRRSKSANNRGVERLPTATSPEPLATPGAVRGISLGSVPQPAFAAWPGITGRSACPRFLSFAADGRPDQSLSPARCIGPSAAGVCRAARFHGPPAGPVRPLCRRSCAVRFRYVPASAAARHGRGAGGLSNHTETGGGRHAACRQHVLGRRCPCGLSARWAVRPDGERCLARGRQRPGFLGGSARRATPVRWRWPT